MPAPRRAWLLSHGHTAALCQAEDCRNLGGDLPSTAAKIDDNAHGSGGPLTTCIRQPVNPIAEAFVHACNQAGHPTVDYNR